MMGGRIARVAVTQGIDDLKMERRTVHAFDGLTTACRLAIPPDPITQAGAGWSVTDDVVTCTGCKIALAEKMVGPQTHEQGLSRPAPVPADPVCAPGLDLAGPDGEATGNSAAGDVDESADGGTTPGPPPPPPPTSGDGGNYDALPGGDDRGPELVPPATPPSVPRGFEGAMSGGNLSDATDRQLDALGGDEASKPTRKAWERMSSAERIAAWVKLYPNGGDPPTSFTRGGCPHAG